VCYHFFAPPFLLEPPYLDWMIPSLLLLSLLVMFEIIRYGHSSFFVDVIFSEISWITIGSILLILAGSGMVIMWQLRSHPQLKHSMIVLVKWMLRSVGISCIYCSFASVTWGLRSCLFCFIIYLVYSGRKKIQRLFVSRENRSNTKKKD
jgi:hypothetical protein